MKTLIQQQVRSLELKTHNYIEWSQFRQVLQNELINPIISTLLESFRELVEENKSLLAKLNPSAFVNDPCRDKQILELHQQGLNNSEIGRAVGMTRQGVTKALKRLNGNSVDT